MQPALSRVLGVAALACVLLQGQASAQTPVTPSALTKLLSSELSRFSGVGGIYLKHLGTGEEASVRGDQHFDSASTIKLAVLVLAYRMADEGKLNLSDRYEVKRVDFRGGAGILKLNEPGLKPTYRDLLTQLVITSDDTATDIMIAKVGGVQKVNAFLKEQGFKTLHLNMTTNDYFRRPYELIDPKYKTMSASDVFDLQDNRTILTDPRQIALQKQLAQETIDHHISEQMLKREPVEDSWLGVVSPAEIGRMLEGIERGTIASKQACDEMKKALRSQQAGTRKMPHFLSVPIAHKTGETRGVTNDVGMIYAHSGTIIVSFFTNGYTGLASEADDRLGHVARLIVEYFDGTN